MSDGLCDSVNNNEACGENRHTDRGVTSYLNSHTGFSGVGPGMGCAARSTCCRFTAVEEIKREMKDRASRIHCGWQSQG